MNEETTSRDRQAMTSQAIASDQLFTASLLTRYAEDRYAEDRYAAEKTGFRWACKASMNYFDDCLMKSEDIPLGPPAHLRLHDEELLAGFRMAYILWQKWMYGEEPTRSKARTQGEGK